VKHLGDRPLEKTAGKLGTLALCEIAGGRKIPKMNAWGNGTGGSNEIGVNKLKRT